MTDNQPKEVWSSCKCGSVREGTPQDNEQAICPDCKRTGLYVLADDQPKDPKPMPIPGAWRRDHATIIDTDDQGIAFVTSTDAIGDLIVAAPDLLGACVEFVRKCECGEARSERSYGYMKAAIARATGGSRCQRLNQRREQ